MKEETLVRHITITETISPSGKRAISDIRQQSELASGLRLSDEDARKVASDYLGTDYPSLELEVLGYPCRAALHEYFLGWPGRLLETGLQAEPSECLESSKFGN